jgi:hypothetical protein
MRIERTAPARHSRRRCNRPRCRRPVSRPDNPGCTSAPELVPLPKMWRATKSSKPKCASEHPLRSPAASPRAPARKGHSPSHYCRFDGPRPSCIMFTAKREPILQLQSTLTCPKCSHQAVETMPTDACQFFYECKGCGERLRPLAGDCCVFCSYGSAPCPPIQSNLRCCLPSVH